MSFLQTTNLPGLCLFRSKCFRAVRHRELGSWPEGQDHDEPRAPLRGGPGECPQGRDFRAKVRHPPIYIRLAENQPGIVLKLKSSGRKSLVDEVVAGSCSGGHVISPTIWDADDDAMTSPWCFPRGVSRLLERGRRLFWRGGICDQQLAAAMCPAQGRISRRGIGPEPEGPVQRRFFSPDRSTNSRVFLLIRGLPPRPMSAWRGSLHPPNKRGGADNGCIMSVNEWSMAPHSPRGGGDDR